MSELSVVWIGTISGVLLVGLVWFLAEIVIEKKHRYWRRPDDLKHLSHGVWKGYVARMEALEQTEWDKGWYLAGRDFNAREEASDDSSA